MNSRIRSCPICGYDGSSLSPGDAIVTVRSLPRRYRQVLRVASAGSPSLVSAAQAARQLDAAAAEVRKLTAGDRPTLTLPDPTRPPKVADLPTNGDEAGDRVEAAADDLARAIGAVPPEDWGRQVLTADGLAVDAIDVARAAVHAGLHPLRLLERAQPTDDPDW